jgi:hypothetical protein
VLLAEPAAERRAASPLKAVLDNGSEESCYA